MLKVPPFPPFSLLLFIFLPAVAPSVYILSESLQFQFSCSTFMNRVGESCMRRDLERSVSRPGELTYRQTQIHELYTNRELKTIVVIL